MSTYGYDSYYSTPDVVGSMVGGIMIFVVIMMLIGLAIALCAIIGQWKAFRKAGKGGWEAIIPIYNQITLCNIVGVNPWWILIVAVGGIVLNIIPVIGSIASLALSIYFAVLLNVSAARSFGKSDSFAVGLVLLPPVFWLMLGSKNVQYVGATPMNDVVLNFVTNKTGNNNNNNMNTNVNPNVNNNVAPQNPAGVKFCTGCGYKMTNGERFCPSCGKEN